MGHYLPISIAKPNIYRGKLHFKDAVLRGITLIWQLAECDHNFLSGMTLTG